MLTLKALEKFLLNDGSTNVFHSMFVYSKSSEFGAKLKTDGKPLKQELDPHPTPVPLPTQGAGTNLWRGKFSKQNNFDPNMHTSK